MTIQISIPKQDKFQLILQTPDTVKEGALKDILYNMFFNIFKIKEDKLFQKSYNKKFKNYDVEINFIQNEDNFIYTQHSPLAGIVPLPDVGSYWSFKITCYISEEDLNNFLFLFRVQKDNINPLNYFEIQIYQQNGFTI